MAPFLVTAIEEAFALILKMSATGMPSMIPARKSPVNVSPAAVVSTAFTLNTGCVILVSLSAYTSLLLFQNFLKKIYI